MLSGTLCITSKTKSRRTPNPLNAFSLCKIDNPVKPVSLALQFYC